MAGGAIPKNCDVLIVGGGFYGCCLALFFRSIVENVVIVESRDDLLTRASYVNQARIHTGFHYPRSFVTARRSLELYRRFITDFKAAVVDDFTMLYAIARSGSKITPQRFAKMFEDMKAPIEPASKAERALFGTDMVADVFRCQEYAFDAVILRDVLRERLQKAGVQVLTSVTVKELEPAGASGEIVAKLVDRTEMRAPVVVDATYGQFRHGPGGAAMLKYEMTELVLIEPPGELQNLAVTVMDGPFFSTMPFPAQNCYSLAHVRYTPHSAWTSADAPRELPAKPPSHWLHMQRDAARFLPCLHDARWQGSLYEIKTVLVRNEGDDGRPILLDRDQRNPGLLRVLGGKLDNIYDLFDGITAFGGDFAQAHTGYLSGRGGGGT